MSNIENSFRYARVVDTLPLLNVVSTLRLQALVVDDFVRLVSLFNT